MTELILLLIALGSGTLVVLPLLREVRRPWAVAEPSGEGEALRQEELVALEALRDLAMDFKLGNLSEPDYRSLAVPLQTRLKRTHGLQAEHSERQMAMPVIAPDLDHLLEAEIQAARRVDMKPGANGQDSGSVSHFCHQCGAPVGMGHRFCATCGTALKPSPVSVTPPASAAAGRLATTVHGPSVPAKVDAGATAAEEIVPASTGRRWLWWGAAAIAVLWVAGVVGIYINGRNSQTARTPLARFDAPVETIATAGDVLLLGTRDGALRSADSRTWVATNLHEPVLTLTSLDEAGDRWLATTSTGLWRSDDGGDIWRSLTENELGFVDLTAPSGMGVVWGLTDNALYASEDEGRTWLRLSASLPGQGRALAVGAGTIFVGTDQGVFASNDGGQSWASQNGSVNGRIVNLDVRALAYDDANGLLYAGTPAGLSFLNTVRNGSWGQRSFQGVVTALRLSGENNQVLWVGTEDGRLFRSPDRGVSWR